MSEPTIENNKVVSITYVISDETGVQEQSDLPVSYLHGENNTELFPRVAEALTGARVGDEIEVELTPEDGFGLRDPSKTFSDAIENVPEEFRHIGAEAEFRNDLGESLTMTVVSVDNGQIVLDGNHPYAGKTMTFKITVKDIRDAAADEIETGKVLHGDGLKKDYNS